MLIVEDIVDSGLTLQYLLRNLGARDPASIEVCALLTKPERRKVEVEPRYVGFEIPNRFVDRLRARSRRALPQPPLRRRARPSAEPAPGLTRLGAARPSVGTDTPYLLGSPFVADRAFQHEQVLQERGVPDPDRRDPGVLRAAAHQRARTRRRTPASAPSSSSLPPARSRRSRCATAPTSCRSRATTRAQYRVGFATELRRPLDQGPAEGREHGPDPGVRRQGHAHQRLAVDADLRAAVPALHRLLDLPDEPDAGRRLEGHVVRQVQGQADVGRRAEDHLP